MQVSAQFNPSCFVTRKRVRTRANTHIPGRNIAIIGTGEDAKSIASSIIHRKIAKCIYFDDEDKDKLKKVISYFEDVAFVKGTNIQEMPSKNSLQDCSIVVITLENSHINTLQNNLDSLGDVLKTFQVYKNPHIKIILACEPVDVFTHVVQEWCDGVLSRNQIIGTGTCLDTLRIQVALAKHLHISPKNVQPFVVGKQGQNQVFAGSVSHIAGRPLSSFPQISAHVLDTMVEDVKNKIYSENSSFGFGESVASICESILFDKNEVMTVSCYHKNFATCLGWPSIIGQDGVRECMDLQLSLRECEALLNSVDIIKRSVYSALISPS
jgi:L-lactate dehydrogenase